MSENTDRDMHFVNFAKSLIHDLDTTGFNEHGCRSAEGTQDIIAQHAYNLVHQVIQFYRPGDTPEQVRDITHGFSYILRTDH